MIRSDLSYENEERKGAPLYGGIKLKKLICNKVLSQQIKTIACALTLATALMFSTAAQAADFTNRETDDEVKWDGPVLDAYVGTVEGPSGKETYYNLDMSGIIEIMRSMGNTDEYWIREDGCKMLGDYIMCAANLDVHPRGTLVESSLGTCIVCDTGGFAAANPNQLDIATNW